MKLTFTKMHGAGNDFVVLDATAGPLELSATQLRGIADRQRGVGADQILVVGPPRAADIDFSYRIFNADGNEVEQCGNGARAFVRYVTEKGLTQKRAIRVETRSGVIEPRLEADGTVTVDMGPCVLDAARVPFLTEGLTARQDGAASVWPLEVGGVRRDIVVASMGNPHAVQIVDDVEAAPVHIEGPLIEHHARFPRRVNAGYAEVLDRHTIRLRVWERGAGETLACGTGACAAVVAGIQCGRLDTPVRVLARGGTLEINWQGGTSPVFMNGPAVTVFDGVLDLDALPA